MRMLEHMSIEETAAALHIPAGTVKTRLHRANQQLRETLGTELSAALEGAFHSQPCAANISPTP